MDVQVGEVLIAVFQSGHGWEITTGTILLLGHAREVSTCVSVLLGNHM